MYQMQNFSYTSDNFSELYQLGMEELLERCMYSTSPRGQKINENINSIFVLTDPTSNLFSCPDDRSVTHQTGYLKRELTLYLAATNSAELFTKASAFWDKIKNSDNTINSAYGNLIFNPSLSDGRSQWEWAKDSLIKDMDSRQAIVRFNNTIHQTSDVKDFPCTLVGIFHIRNNALQLTINMRSNDIRKGFQYDLPFFTLMQYLMYLELKPYYPDLTLGSYVHIANSFHLYESDFEYAKTIVNTQVIPKSMPMPKNPKLIKSEDMNKILHYKFKGGEKPADFDYSENIDFYNWLMS